MIGFWWSICWMVQLIFRVFHHLHQLINFQGLICRLWWCHKHFQAWNMTWKCWGNVVSQCLPSPASPSKLKVCCEHSKISHHQNPGHFHATKLRNAVKYKANSFMVSPCITNGWRPYCNLCFPGHHWLPHAIPHAMPHMMPHAMPIPHPMAPTMPGEMETWSHLFQRWVCFHL